ncbi:MLX-interacting protein-like isoform X2 [Hemicordylus capensis]|uniref:MLX-interacting protein-like isoform X2 n=1 Tax=Hemicordylus capensis TaxID=884348 RepID=UPI0023047DEC|nr:MLX-interacting protein-like isoform X2 [Hemicordylus capensis]
MSRPQIIHSGHFMVSEPHAEPDPDPEPDPDSEAAALSPAGQVAPRLPGSGPGPCAVGRGRRACQGGRADEGAQQTTYDFDTVSEGTCLTYRYGPRSSGALNIDASLTKLFECMTLAYSGKIVSPKWKTFKGLKLLQRDKIRLNNAIWRAWYLQYVEKRQNPVCSFVTPLECSDVVDEHRKPEAVIMEGKYWKRQIGVVIREYRKWRAFSHKREVADTLPGVELNSEMTVGSPMELDPLNELDALLDTLFSSRNPYGGPNLRGLAHQGNADMIQPTLTQLHPSFGEEFMTLDPIHDFINSCRPQPAVQAPSLLTDATALGQCGPDVSPITSGTKELPSSGDSLIPIPIPISLDVEPSMHLNEQQTFLPLFPTSPLRISPPPAPPILHIQPQTTLVFSVITHTGSEKTLPSTSGGTFAVPTSAVVAKGGRSRHLQRIAPAPSSSNQAAPPSASLAQLLTTGPAPLPLTPVTNAAQVCSTSKFPANALLRSVSATEKSPLPASVAASSDPGVHTERAEDTNLCNTQEIYRHSTAKGSRRSTFVSADYTRRMVISSGFNTLASLVLPRSDQASAKLSKAMLLQKSVAYVGRLQHERRQTQEMMERLRREIKELNTAIHEFQRQLPPSGAPVLLPQSDKASQLYEEYVRQRTLNNWRFWLFSTVIKPLFESYTRTVSTSNIKEFCQSVLSWLEQHCTLPLLRPAISGSLLQLSKITSILTQPARLPEQALQAVSCPPHCKGNS